MESLYNHREIPDDHIMTATTTANMNDVKGAEMSDITGHAKGHWTGTMPD